MGSWGSSEIFRPDDGEKARYAARKGELRRVARGLYTTNLDEPLDRLVKRKWADVAGIYYPRSVVVDRSAVGAAPDPDGSLFLDVGPRPVNPRPTSLPGLALRPRNGPGRVEGDMPYLEIFVSSRGRWLLDNLRPSRRRQGVTRTLDQEELEQSLDRIARNQGDSILNEIRDQARHIAPLLGREAEMEQLDEIIGSLLGTRDAHLKSEVGRSRQRQIGYDSNRVEMFEVLREELSGQPLPIRAGYEDPFRQAAFYESYFSNWIEGTEFQLDEARQIVFEGRIPDDRPADAHDITGTFDAVLSPRYRATAPTGFDELEGYLRGVHQLVMGGRPELSPGQYKTRPNQAGTTVFVRPELVRGTLIEGFRLRESLTPGLPRAIFNMFLVSEVHPFVDGNGRVSRLLMNAELSDADSARIMIPPIYRDEYLNALRALSNYSNPTPVWKMLDRAQKWACSLDWTDEDGLRAEIERTNALVPSNEAEDLHLADGPVPSR